MIPKMHSIRDLWINSRVGCFNNLSWEITVFQKNANVKFVEYCDEYYIIMEGLGE